MEDAAGTAALRHPLLERLGVVHGFGTAESMAPEGTLRPIQVHGKEVMVVRPAGASLPIEADAIVCDVAGQTVGVVTADCVPILACCESGEVVAAIHAGWRGLAAGVVEAGLAALRERAPSGAEIYAAIGPHIGACCYEVDAPVLDALGERFGETDLRRACTPTRPGHAMIDLGLLVEVDLTRSGLARDAYARLPESCTQCSGERFHSFRRSGEAAGRMTHYVATIWK